MPLTVLTPSFAPPVEIDVALVVSSRYRIVKVDDEMAFIKSFLVGFLGLVAYIVCMTIWSARAHISVGEGSGGVGAVSLGLFEALFPWGLIAFALAFWWQWRRTRRRTTMTRRRDVPENVCTLLNRRSKIKEKQEECLITGLLTF